MLQIITDQINLIDKWANDEIKYFIIDNILFCHGDKFGQLSIDEEYLLDIYDNLLMIVCCHPAKVAKMYQRLGFIDIASKLYLPEHEGEITLFGFDCEEGYKLSFVAKE